MKKSIIEKYLLMSFYTILINLVFAGTVLATTTGRSQNIEQMKLEFETRSCTLKEFFNEVEQTSEFRFFYVENEIDENSIVAVDSKENFKDLLQDIANQQMLHFKIINEQIVVKKAKRDRPEVIEQEVKTIKGKVTDSSGQPLPGASVVIKGTTIGVTTDVNGDYSLDVPVDAKTLLFSFIGMKIQEIAIGNQTQINVVLEEESIGLDEVVAIGYGSVKKKDLTGSVANITGEKLSNANATSVAQALQGTMPGIQVTRSSGLPGASATIRVRGITTIGDSNPLIIVDGVPTSSINNVDADDIESVSVLKDAASASIYGARASAGVILITTKRAKATQLNFEYHGTYGIVKPTKFPEQVSYKRYMEMINEIAWNDGGNIAGADYEVYSKDYIDSYAENNKINPDAYPITNWVDVLINDSAPRTKHRFSVTYGNEVIKSKFLVNYEKTDALYNNRSYEVVTTRLNNDIKINNFLSVQIYATYNHSLSENTTVNPLVAAYKYGPLWTPYYSDGRISEGREGTNTWARLNYGGFNNTWGDQFSGKLALNITPVKNLTISGVFAPSVQISKGKLFTKQIPYYDREDPNLFVGYISGNSTTSLEESRNDTRNTTKQLLINYSADIGKNHGLSLMMGYEDYYRFSEGLTAFADNFMLTDYPYLDRAPLDNMSNTGNANENAYNSYFGRVTYDYANKYLFQANLRYDASSRFHEDYRWAKFPSASLGWVVTEESFFKNLNFNPLSFLKLRGSWGTLGNERIGNYPYQSIMNFENALFVEDGQIVSSTTAAQQSYNIREITWETTETWNIGLDATFFNNRLSLNGDYYKKTTHDMLLALEIPDFMGYSNPSQNAGTMNTKGWEVLLQWNDKIGDFRYSVSANISDYKSVMGDLSGTVFDGDQIIMEGSEYNEWYGYLSDGLYQSQEDVDSSPLLNNIVKPGDVKYKDVSGPDGVPDGKISPEYDRVLLGGSLPRYLYGGNIDLRYKGFDASLVFQGIGKQTSQIVPDMVYQTVQWYTFPDFVDGNYYSEYNSEEKNKTVKYPRLSEFSYEGNNYEMSDYWLFDGSYFRLKNVTLGYTFPNKVVDKLNVSNLRIYASVSDLFSIDNYPKGWDPEAGLNAYIARTWNFGVSIKF